MVGVVMEGTVATPFGHVRKPVLIGGVVVVGLFGVYTYRKNKAAAAAQSSTTPAATDPATGFPYGSPEDTAALANQAQQTAASYGYGGGGGGGGLTGAATGAYLSTAPSAGGFSDNGQWAQAAETYLQSTAGADPTVVAAALGKYITGQGVTDAQQSIIQQSIAFEGYPPVAGPGGYPPGIKPIPTPPTPTPTPTPSPGGAGSVEQFPAPNGLRAVAVGRTTATIEWQPVQVGGIAPDSYTVDVWQLNGYNKTGRLTTSGTSIDINGLHPAWQYHVQVWANGGKTAPPGSIIEITMQR